MIFFVFLSVYFMFQGGTNTELNPLDGGNNKKNSGSSGYNSGNKPNQSSQESLTSEASEVHEPLQDYFISPGSNTGGSFYVDDWSHDRERGGASEAIPLLQQGSETNVPNSCVKSDTGERAPLLTEDSVQEEETALVSADIDYKTETDMQAELPSLDSYINVDNLTEYNQWEQLSHNNETESNVNSNLAVSGTEEPSNVSYSLSSEGSCLSSSSESEIFGYKRHLTSGGPTSGHANSSNNTECSGTNDSSEKMASNVKGDETKSSGRENAAEPENSTGGSEQTFEVRKHSDNLDIEPMISGPDGSELGSGKSSSGTSRCNSSPQSSTTSGFASSYSHVKVDDKFGPLKKNGESKVGILKETGYENEGNCEVNLNCV